MDDFIERVLSQLLAKKDEEYGDFQHGLVPNLSRESIIGVRLPILRRLARSIASTPDAELFLDDLPHSYYDENNLHMMLINYIPDYATCISRIDAFLPYVDNWATCDSMSPAVLKKNSGALMKEIKRWLDSEHCYTKRFAIGMLMRYYLSEQFKPEYLKWIAEIQSDEYYVNMMRAWFFSTALAKQYDATIPYFENSLLDTWTHNKAIQKSIESFRIGTEKKTYLRKLKVKA